MLIHRTLSATAATSEIRSAQYDGRAYTVVPVVALVGDTVVRPIGSEGPEFVPAVELAKAPAQWNNRPVVMNHPDGGYSSAGDPMVMERLCFGWLFGSEYSDGRLRTLAYLDPERAKKVGPEAERVIERCRAGEIVEISIGAFLSLEKRSGVAPNGATYEYIWHDVKSDHLAMLSEGSTGACSVDKHGCGAPRVMQERQEQEQQGQPNLVMRAAETEEKPRMKLPKRLSDSFAAIINMFRGSEDEGLSDVDMRDRLSAALRAVEPGFDWIVRVFPESSTVIYTTIPEDKMLLWRRSFAVGGDDAISLNDDREEVQLVEKYEPVSRAATATVAETVAVAETATVAATATTTECACQKHLTSSTSTASTTTSDKSDKGGDITMPKLKKDLVNTLITSDSTVFAESDRKALEGLSDNTLQFLADQAEKQDKPDDSRETTPPAPTPPAAPTLPQAPQTPQTPNPEPNTAHLRQIPEDEYASMKAAAEAYQRQQAEAKSRLVSSLRSATTVYTEEQLNAKDMNELQLLAKVLKLDQPIAVDFTGSRVVPRAAGAEDIYRNPPDPYGLKKKTA